MLTVGQRSRQINFFPLWAKFAGTKIVSGVFKNQFRFVDSVRPLYGQKVIAIKRKTV